LSIKTCFFLRKRNDGKN